MTEYVETLSFKPATERHEDGGKGLIVKAITMWAKEINGKRVDWHDKPSIIIDAVVDPTGGICGYPSITITGRTIDG